MLGISLYEFIFTLVIIFLVIGKRDLFNSIKKGLRFFYRVKFMVQNSSANLTIMEVRQEIKKLEHEVEAEVITTKKQVRDVFGKGITIYETDNVDNEISSFYQKSKEQKLEYQKLKEK